MVGTNSVQNAEYMERGDSMISIFLALYVLLFYIPISTFPAIVAQAALYLFLGITIFKLITKQTPLKITYHSVWYLAFGILGLASSFYALTPSYVFKDIYVVFVSWILAFSFIQFVRDYSGFKRIFFVFAYSPIILAFLLFMSGAINAQGERLGQSLFGNANRIAMYLMISLFCISWFIVYAKRKYLLINIILALVTFFITALTGGRKYLLVPFLFLILLLIFKNWRNNKKGLIFYLLIFVLIVLFGAWAVMNVPSLYNSIGVRFEGLLK